MKNNRGNKKNTFTRLIKTLFEFYPVLLPIIIALILFNSVVSSIPSIFMQNIIAVIENTGVQKTGYMLSLKYYHL